MKDSVIIRRKANEPCQGGNAAALSWNLRVYNWLSTPQPLSVSGKRIETFKSTVCQDLVNAIQIFSKLR